jgi:hypothetical protein
MIEALAVSGGLSALGSFLGKKKAASAQSANLKKGLKMQDFFMNQQDAKLGQAQQRLEGIIPMLNKGYGLARMDLATQGNSARRNVMTNQNQSQAGALQSLTSRGLGSTTVLDAARRGIASDTSRALADIDERIGSLFANLRIQQTGAVAGANQNVAQFMANRAQTQYGAGLERIQTMLGNQVQQPNPFDALGAGFNSATGILALGKYAGLS